MFKDILKKGFVKEIWQVYVLHLFSSLFFGGSIVLLYYTLNGVSLVQIGIMTSIIYATNILLEYPTGIFADKYGRKLSLQLCMFFFFLQVLSMYLFPNFYVFMLSSVFIGIAFSFQSGAHEALIYDSLKSIKKEKKNKYVIGLIDSIYGAGMFLSALAGPFLYQLSPRLPFLLSGIAFLIGLIVFSTFKEPKYHSKKEKVKFHETFKEGVKLIFQNKTLLFLLLIYVSLFFFEHAWSETSQILLTDAGFPLIFLGFFYGIRSLLMIFGGVFLPRLVHKFKSTSAIFIGIFMQTIGLLFLSNSNPYVMAFFSYFLFFSHGIWTYVEADIIHKHIPSRIRATTLSARQMLVSIVFLFNPWFMTFLVGTYGKSIFLLFGALAFVISSFMFIVGRKHLK